MFSFTTNFSKLSRTTTFNVLNRNRSNDSLKYCLDSVRQHDNENFLSTLLLNNDIRTRAIIIRAFNVEVARIQDQISEKHIGLMRFQFWTDALDKITSGATDNIPEHPVVQELYKINSQKKISKRNLLRLLNSRKNFLTQKFFGSLEDIEKYAEESVSPVFYSLLEDAGIKNVSADHAASHLGKAQGIANMLRSVEYSAKNRTVLLPQDILMKHNVSQETVLRRAESKVLRDVTFEIASRANQHLTKARSIKVPSEAKKIFLPAVAVDSYLKRLQKRDFSLFDAYLKTTDSLLSMKYYCYKLLSKY